MWTRYPILTAGAAAALVAACTLTAPAQEPPPGGKAGPEAAPPQEQQPPLSPEVKVLSKIHQTNQMEIKAGKLAREKGHAEDVRDYGDRLVRDHRMADQKVKALARAEGITLVKVKPQTPKEKKRAERQKQTMQKLQKLEGEAFDQAYLNFMVGGHEHSIQTLSKALENKLQDPDVRSLVDKLIPILDQHLELAKGLGGESPEPEMLDEGEGGQPQKQGGQPQKPDQPRKPAAATPRDSAGPDQP